MSRRIVVDASAAVRVVLGFDEEGELAAELRAATVVVAPGLFAAEVANALRGYSSRGLLTAEEAIDRYEEALTLVDDFVVGAELTVEGLNEAQRHGHPVYDLLYAVLARRTASTLLTRDRKLASLARSMGVPAAT